VHAITLLARSKVLHCWDNSLFLCLQLEYSFLTLTSLISWSLHCLFSFKLDFTYYHFRSYLQRIWPFYALSGFPGFPLKYEGKLLWPHNSYILYPWKTRFIWIMLRSDTNLSSNQAPGTMAAVASENLNCLYREILPYILCVNSRFLFLKSFKWLKISTSLSLLWVRTNQFLRCPQGITPIALMQSTWFF
jgi:hypothetical protein